MSTQNRYPVLRQELVCPLSDHTVAAADIKQGAAADASIMAGRHSLWDPLQADAFFQQQKERWRQDGALHYTELLPHEESSSRRAEFERVSNLFFEFVAKDRASDFQIHKIVFLHNELLEQQFLRCYEQLLQREMSVCRLLGQHRQQQHATAAPSWTQQQAKTLQQLASSLGRVSGSEQVNLLLAWHGNYEKRVWQAAREGVYIPAPLTAEELQQLDAGELTNSRGDVVQDAGFYGTPL